MITATTATMLRSGVSSVSRSCGLQPILLLRTTTTTTTTTTSCPYSSLAVSPFSVRSKLADAFAQHHPVPAATKPSSILVFCRQQSATSSSARRRHASTSTSTSTSTSASASTNERDVVAAALAADRSTAQAKANPDMSPLDWNTFFKLRKARRRWQVAFSVVLSLSSSAGGALLLSTGAADPVTAQIPMDPLLTLGLMTLGCAALGWLAGPFLGSAVFYVMRRKYKAPMAVKENQFYARVKKNRSDPSNSSASNPVPDFYGEKISSVAGYRQWLKDQRAYNKKRTTFI